MISSATGLPVHSTLAPFDAASLNDEPSSICALTEELRISFVNAAWDLFARTNGASWAVGEWGVGTQVMDAIPAVLRPFYQAAFDTALIRREVLEHDYECSSAETLRRFRMRVLPCTSGGLLVVHSLLQQSPHALGGGTEPESLYRREGGMIVQCSHCRRVQRASRLAEWDWVPAFVERPAPQTSHGLCRLCTEFYYPESGDLDA